MVMDLHLRFCDVGVFVVMGLHFILFINFLEKVIKKFGSYFFLRLKSNFSIFNLKNISLKIRNINLKLNLIYFNKKIQ